MASAHDHVVKWRNLVADAKHHSAHDGEGEKKAHGCDKEAAARAIGNAFVQERAETSVTKKRKQQHDHPQQH